MFMYGTYVHDMFLFRKVAFKDHSFAKVSDDTAGQHIPSRLLYVGMHSVSGSCSERPGWKYFASLGPECYTNRCGCYDEHLRIAKCFRTLLACVSHDVEASRDPHALITVLLQRFRSRAFISTVMRGGVHVCCYRCRYVTQLCCLRG